MLMFVCTSAATCGRRGSPATHTVVTIATGDTAGVYYPLGKALAEVYTARIPGVTAVAQPTLASVFNVDAVQQGKADMAFTQADIAYLAYTRGTDASPWPHRELRGIAVLYPNTVQIVARRNSAIHTVRDFKGKRISVGVAGSGTEVAARVIIEAYGLKYADIQAQFLSFSETAARLENRTLDGGILVASYPVSAISDANAFVGVRFISVNTEIVARIRARYPFFRPSRLPPNTYRGQTERVDTISVDNLLVCRANLDQELVYQLTRTLFDALAQLARSHVAAALIDVDQAPTTSVPLHRGAARYYRERERGW
jgi:TRAP transporter TAXI family solute receptor